MATVKKLPSGNWRAQVYVGTDANGKRIRKSVTRDTKAKALRAAELLAAQHEGIATGNISLGDAMDAYINLRRHTLSPSTIEGYEKIKRLYFLDLQKKNIQKITQTDLQRSIDQQAMRLAPKTIANNKGFLVSVFKKFRPSFVVDVSTPALVIKNKILPNAKDVAQAIKGTDIELPVMLAMWLTMRMSEVRGLRKADIYDGVIYVNQTILTVKGADITRQQAKTAKSIRRLILPDYIKQLIDKLPPEQEYLTVLSAKQIRYRFNKLLRNNNIPHICFHDLRHISASIMLQIGIPDKYQMERGGWSTNSTLKRVYQHTFSDVRKQVDEQINDYYDTNILQ